MLYKDAYKNWSEESREKHRARWREYYYRNRERLKADYLSKWHKNYATKEGKERLIKNNSRAKSNERFGIKDRTVIISKYNNRCVFCLGEDKRLLIHHIDNNGRRTKTPNNSPENLVTCCHSCHALIHFHNKNLQMKI